MVCLDCNELIIAISKEERLASLHKKSSFDGFFAIYHFKKGIKYY